MIDLKGQTLMPGFVEPHVHIINTAVSNVLWVNLSNFTLPYDTLDSLAQKLKAQLGTVPQGGWLLASGADPSRTSPFMAELTADILDKVSTEVPIFVMNQSDHIAYVNHKALELAGINDQTPNPGNGGVYVKDAQGKLTGKLLEFPAFATVMSKFPAPTQAQLIGAIQKTMKNMASKGATTVADVGVGSYAGIEKEVAIYKDLVANGAAPVRVRGYEQWRNNEMGITPKASTLMTHASAYSRVIKSAVQRGWVSANSPIAFLNRRGKASTPRAGFTREEVHKLLGCLPEFANGGHTELARDMRKLLRDYVEILIATGMRCGKESMNLQWKHVDWYDEAATGKRYLRLYVNGKTGGRQLIVRNFGIAAFERLAIRQKDLIAKNLNEAIKRKTTIRVFRLSDGTQPKSLHTTFKWLLHFAHLTYDAKTKQQRTLYSLRHAYATLALMDDAIDIHTLARQMGTSVGMLEKHYSKLTATMAAEKLS